MAKPGAAYSGIEMTSQRTRNRMVERLREKGICNEQVLTAMSEIPRHIFIEKRLKAERMMMCHYRWDMDKPSHSLISSHA